MQHPGVIAAIAVAPLVFVAIFLALWQAEINARHRRRMMRRRSDRNLIRMGGGS